jgi:DNA-binding MurR/RpiR family transcriptional regulator
MQREPSPATIADRLRLAAEAITPAEQRVARILFSSAMLAGLDTVANLAERAGVSSPTVIRLTTKLGFESYLDFQKMLRAELEERSNSPLSLFEKAPRPAARDDLLAESRAIFAATLQSSLARVSPTEFASVVELLCDARRPLFLTGGRFTQLLADMLYLHLFQMRPQVHLMRDGVQPRADQLLDVGPRGVLMVHDVRRYQADTVRLARRAKERGATIILATDPWESPIAEIADHVLVAEVTSPSPFDSMVPAFALGEALIAGVMRRMGPAGIRRIREIETFRGGFEWQGDQGSARRTGSIGPRGRKRQSKGKR